ncbi:unnamed protein product [Symbiodinium natans]|uniref:TM2 domain-containing protein n=1 Tax=Symbiodinium natans TaxID=878477 RepID=A0A812TKN0_9DINO|nr:unnamed protein product [Symbiodinium natans]
MAIKTTEGNEWQVLGLALVALWGVYQTLRWCCSCCCRCCCGKREAPPAAAPLIQPDKVKVDGREVSAAHLIQTKDARTAYFLWLTMGLVGAHHFYADRLLHGVLAACSGNFFGVGWFLDFFLIPTYVAAINRQVPPEVARPDNSCGRLTCRLPVIVTTIIVVFLAFIFRFPAILHGTGVVDLEQRMAGTAGNPYVILEVERDLPQEDIRKAYSSQLKEVEGSKDCQTANKACKAKKQNLKKAAEFILHGPPQSDEPQKEKTEKKARRKPREKNDDDAWADWGDYLRAEWDAVGQEIKEGSSQFAKNLEKDYFS